MSYLGGSATQETWQVLKVPNGQWGSAGWGCGVTEGEEGQLEPVLTH